MTTLSDLEKRLWEAADQLRANSDLTSAEYSSPVLGLVFLRFADIRFAEVHSELEGSGSGQDAYQPSIING
ncbi:MAG: type I restriction-modification system subunit M N-terminal domain-containing protein [Pseudomonadota bacterium]|nr:type I restriction-modification system subunit M N-terminal domain-containing protein [Pseudomonadota bacterium]